MMSTSTFVLLLLCFFPATWAVQEERRVLMLAAHDSQCTHEDSSCVEAIQSYIAAYFDDDEEVEEEEEEDEELTRGGKQGRGRGADDKSKDRIRGDRRQDRRRGEPGGLRHRNLFSCTGHGSCDRSADTFFLCIMYGGCGNGRRRATAIPNSLELFNGNGDDNCYLSGVAEDEQFHQDIIGDLGSRCPCVKSTNFFVQNCQV